jgi:holin-like protein
MIVSLTLLLLCQLVGEILARGLALPLPGPVIGMALLLVVLVLRGPTTPTPAGTNSSERWASRPLPVLSRVPSTSGGGRPPGTLVVSTAAALAATVLTFTWVARWTTKTTAKAPGTAPPARRAVRPRRRRRARTAARDGPAGPCRCSPGFSTAAALAATVLTFTWVARWTTKTTAKAPGTGR